MAERRHHPGPLLARAQTFEEIAITIERDDQFAEAGSMEPRHPYTGAAYRVIRQADRTFGVEVRVPDANPTMVTSFSSKWAAEAWIVAHKKRVTDLTSLGRRWVKKRSPSD